MKKTIIAITTILILLTFIFMLQRIEGKTQSFTKNLSYPVKIHISGLSDGEIITYNIDDSQPQYVNKSSFLVYFKAGSHNLFVSCSNNKWGMTNLMIDNSSLIKDVYINVSQENKPYQNFK